MLPTPTAELEGISKPTQHHRYQLGLEPTRLGRGSSCSVIINDPLVSRQHAEIRYEAGVFVLRDLESTHGTFVDGVRVGETRLQDGSRIRLGDSEWVFHLAPKAVPTNHEPGVGMAPAAASPSGPAPAIPTPAAAQKAKPSRGQATRRKVVIGCGIPAVLMACLCLAVAAIVAIFYPGGLNAAADRILGGSTAGYDTEDLALALSVPLVDERLQILSSLGRPDEFDIAILDVEGSQVRRESWYYYGFGTRVDFVDGTIVWIIDLDPAPEGAIFPAWYDPTVFIGSMSLEAAASAAAAASPSGKQPQVIDLSTGGEDLLGAVLLVGDQITLAFQDGALVYVETVGVRTGGGG